jgi:DNA-directed RNA polymerase subunit A"
MSRELLRPFEVELPPNLKAQVERIARAKKLDEKRLEERVKAEYLKAKFEPGETIGILASHSISEPATQMTMRTFHIAGAAAVKVTLGLPRLTEVFDARPTKTPSMRIYLKSAHNTQKTAQRMARSIIEQTVVNFIERVSLDLKAGTIELVLAKLSTKTLERILRRKYPELKLKTKGKLISIKPKEKRVEVLHRVKDRVLATKIGGIDGVKDAVVERVGDRWVITTVGTNLAEVLKLPEVDATRTISNDILEIAPILGIEAARNVIIREAMKTLAEQGLDVDIRHIMLVADLMTYRGRVEGLNRYGVMKIKPSVLNKAGFEETVKHIVHAAIKNEVDPLEGIFENVMIGKVVPCGTGAVRLIAKPRR